MAAALRAAFASVDAEILARCRGRGGREGTTALVALRVGRQLWTAHLGDARAVLARVEREKEKGKKGSKEKEKVANGGVKKEAEAGAAAAAAGAAAATAAPTKEEEEEEEEKGDAKSAPAPAPVLAPASTGDDNDGASTSDDDDDENDVKRAGPTIITRSPQSPYAAAPLPRQEQHKSHLPPFLRSLWQHTHQNGSGSNTTAAAVAAAAAKNASRASQPPPSSSSNSRIKAVRLTHDHKPDLPHERARVLAAGGRVEWQGCWRVVAESPLPGRPAAGLAVSRSLGDAQFKEPLPLVSSDPDVSVTLLQPGDTMLILASDGVWDVLSDQDAAEVAVAAALKAAAAATEEEDDDEEMAAAAAAGGGNGAKAASDVKNEGCTAAAAATEAAGSNGGPEKAASEEEEARKKKDEEDKKEQNSDDDEDPSSLGLNVPLRSGFCPIATAAAEAVIAAALSRGTMDNVTALCAVLPWEW